MSKLVPYYDQDGLTIFCGDCLEVMPQLDADSIDTIITDPPYGLKFMGKDWDHGVPGILFWQAALRVAKPGAMLLAFGGTRTHHRLMCAIEDAGWEIRDVIMWVYASGFPKSANISKHIDKAAGAEREVMGTAPDSANRKETVFRGAEYKGGWTTQAEGERTITAPATPAAKLWNGYGTALKPAWEPIIVAMKPRDGTFANNALEHGVAGLWVDGGRVAINDDDYKEMAGRSGGHSSHGPNDTNIALGKGLGRPIGEVWEPERKGRWPANLILTYPENEYIMKEDLTEEQRREIFQWLQENA